MISEIFDPSRWNAVGGVRVSRTSRITVPASTGTVRIANLDRPEVRNAFRPHTVDELLPCARSRARMWTDVGCVLLTGNGPSPKDGGMGVLLRRRSAHPRQGRLQVRGRLGSGLGATRPTAHPGSAAAHPIHAEGRDRRLCRAGARGRRTQSARRLRSHARQPRARALPCRRIPTVASFDSGYGSALLGAPGSARKKARGDLLPRQGPTRPTKLRRWAWSTRPCRTRSSRAVALEWGARGINSKKARRRCAC